MQQFSFFVVKFWTPIWDFLENSNFPSWPIINSIVNYKIKLKYFFLLLNNFHIVAHLNHKKNSKQFKMGKNCFLKLFLCPLSLFNPSELILCRTTCCNYICNTSKLCTCTDWNLCSFFFANFSSNSIRFDEQHLLKSVFQVLTHIFVSDLGLEFYYTYINMFSLNYSTLALVASLGLLSCQKVNLPPFHNSVAAFWQMFFRYWSVLGSTYLHTNSERHPHSRNLVECTTGGFSVNRFSQLHYTLTCFYMSHLAVLKIAFNFTNVLLTSLISLVFIMLFVLQQDWETYTEQLYLY